MEHKRRSFYIACMILFFLGFEAGGFQISLMQMTGEFGISGVKGGLLVSAQQAVVIIMPFLAGIAADRMGKKKILLLAGSVFLCGCIGITMLKEYALLLCSIALIGSGYSICESVTSAYVTDCYKEKAGRYVTLSQCFFSAGALLSPQLMEVGFIFGNVNWKWNFIISGVGCFGAALVLAAFGKNRTYEAARREGEKQKTGKEILCLGIAMFIYGSLEVGVSYYINGFLSTELKSPQAAVWALSLFWLFMIPGRMLGGIFYKWRKKILWGGYLLTGILLIGVSFLNNGITAGVLFGCVGLMLSPIWPFLMSWAAENYGAQSAAATGILSTGCGIAGTLTPVLLGWSIDIGGLRKGFLLLGFGAFIGAIFVVLYEQITKNRMK